MKNIEQLEKELKEEKAANQILNNQLQQSNEELQLIKDTISNINYMRGEFVYSINNSIRTPLFGMVGLAEYLLNLEKVSAQRDYFKRIKSSGEFILTTIDDMLDFFKAETDSLEITNIDFKLRTCIDETLNKLAAIGFEKNINLSYNVTADTPDNIIGDPYRLRQIIYNLLRDLIKYTEDIEIFFDIDFQILQNNTVQLDFHLKSTDSNIPEEVLEIITEIRENSESTPIFDFKEYGINLALSEQLIRLMKGKFWIEQPENKGAYFSFSIRVKRQGNQAESTLISTESSIKGTTILIVEDNATNRYILENILIQWKTQPIIAENNEKAIQILKKAKLESRNIDLVILNNNIPNMDGFELGKLIADEFNDIVGDMMLIASNGKRGDATRCQEIGIHAYLLKPIQQSDLYNGILTLLQKNENSNDHVHLITRHSIRENLPESD